jgi:hypothetical protein
MEARCARGMSDIKSIINRIKQLTYYEVAVELYEPIQFNGTIPFDLEISGNIVVAQVLAESYDEAERKLLTFLFESERDV